MRLKLFTVITLLALLTISIFVSAKSARKKLVTHDSKMCGRCQISEHIKELQK